MLALLLPGSAYVPIWAECQTPTGEVGSTWSRIDTRQSEVGVSGTTQMLDPI